MNSRRTDSGGGDLNLYQGLNAYKGGGNTPFP